jgi:hypothetical protein
MLEYVAAVVVSSLLLEYSLPASVSKSTERCIALAFPAIFISIGSNFWPVDEFGREIERVILAGLLW